MKNKMFVGLSVIIIIGIIIVAIFGFNVDFCYRNYNLVDVTIGQEFNMSDIKNIAKDVFGKQKIEIQESGVYSDNVAIKVESISDEQKENLVSKINEKYGLEKTAEDIKVTEVPSYRLRDIVKPYIIPVAIATAVILVYMAIRFSKIGAGKVLIQIISLSAIAEALYIAIIAITRYPVNRIVMPVAVVIYMSILTILNGMFEKQLESNKKD